jgi:hypothetical protein
MDLIFGWLAIAGMLLFAVSAYVDTGRSNTNFFAQHVGNRWVQIISLIVFIVCYFAHMLLPPSQ